MATRRLIRDLGTVPNLLSLFRLVGMPVAVFLYLEGNRSFAAVLGIAAGATDIFDGILARKLGQVTDLGAVLDRMSDLVVEGFGLLLFVLLARVSPVVLILYLFREFAVTSARMHAAEFQVKLPSGLWGTLKTDFLMAGLTVCVLYDSAIIDHAGFLSFCGAIYPWLLWLGIACSYISGAGYMASYVRAYDSGKTAG